MLADMLDPPELAAEERQSIDDSMRAEHATAQEDANTGFPPSETRRHAN
jgi:hypothetical protein